MTASVNDRVVEFDTLEDFQAWFWKMLKWVKTLDPDDMPARTVKNFMGEMAYWVWETYNTRNRDRRPRWIKELIEIIRSGKWKTHTQGISVSTEDRLNNGQHRLEAIFEADIPVSLVFSFNEPDDAFDALDSGEKRKVSDLGKQRGIENAKEKAAAVKILMALEAGSWTTSGSVSPVKIADWLETHTLMDVVYVPSRRIAHKTQGVKRGSRKSGILAALYLIKESNPGTAEFAEFCEKLESGAIGASNHPILALRNGLIQRTFDDAARADGAQGILTAAAIINGWNTWMRGGRATYPGNFRWDPMRGESFPTPIRRAEGVAAAA